MSLRVLIVDDDPITVEAVRRVLVRAGHEVSTLSGGFGFAVALRKFDPDVVLLDVRMPGLDGAGALKAAREVHEFEPGKPRIILHSGHPAHELARLSAKMGADGFLHKPARKDAILSKVLGASSGAT